MSAPYWVLDSGALMAYVHGVEAVGQVLVDVADVAGSVAIPGICLVEAYSLLDHDEYELLRMLRGNPTVRTVLPSFDLDHADDCPGIGSMARHAGRLGAGHAAHVALSNAAGVVTSRPDQLRRVLGDKWEILEI
ncbi:hypothetical protein [Planosporangium mesophilum]|uniref:PIN domain-containing protein n=1 Tax=Planosporangium mesophilum TaxID=689768 RepID=A0A8J3TCX5_9ACTN|nr:hypothetical protein [Planosporangium mesophilum]NJC85104.1 hypothetical protein [Planosporangium mesophilum]GII24443.1 hypothetical protein Pme01_40400 [Planosporangium mesophilum]